MIITLGADPEFFARNKKKNKIVRMPASISNLQKDGFQGEIHPQYNTCREVLINRIFSLTKRAKESTNGTFTKIYYEIPEKEYEELSDEEKELGCKPEYSAYDGKIIPKPAKSRKKSLGGHIHIGYFKNKRVILQRGTRGVYIKKSNEDSGIKIAEANLNREIVRNIDRLVGILETYLNPYPELERKRKKCYGKAGAYRDTEYGFEYRVFSSYFFESAILISLYYGLIRRVVREVVKNNNLIILKNLTDDDIRYCIDNVDRNMAREILKEYKKEFIDYVKKADISETKFRNLLLLRRKKDGDDFMKALFLKEHDKLDGIYSRSCDGINSSKL